MCGPQLSTKRSHTHTHACIQAHILTHTYTHSPATHLFCSHRGTFPITGCTINRLLSSFQARRFEIRATSSSFYIFFNINYDLQPYATFKLLSVSGGPQFFYYYSSTCNYSVLLGLPKFNFYYFTTCTTGQLSTKENIFKNEGRRSEVKHLVVTACCFFSMSGMTHG